MRPQFYEALAKLLEQYSDTPIEEVIGALETELDALRESARDT